MIKLENGPRKITGLWAALAGLAMVAGLPGQAVASTVARDFVIKITDGTIPGGASVAGQTFQGKLTYDDSDLTPGVPFSRSPIEGFLTMVFPFLDRDLTELDSDRAEEPAATFAADGSLLGLIFSVDVPNQFFIFSDGLSFSYEYSKLLIVDGEEQQVPIASGRGVLNPEESPSTVPLPAAAPLLIGALVSVGALARRRKTART